MSDSSSPSTSSMDTDGERNPATLTDTTSEDIPILPQNDSISDPSLEDSEVDNQDATENDNTNSDQANKSRELKSLLALNKEANLKTNIPHKRKKEMKDSPKSVYSDIESKKANKMNPDNKPFKFPVTAESELEDSQETDGKALNESKSSKRKRDRHSESSESRDGEESGKKSKKIVLGDFKVFKPNKDIFCWRCHREGVNVVCETCPRSYHQRCLKQTITDASHWPCPECVAILKAESTQTRSTAMKGMTLEHLCNLLKFAVNRMIQCHGSEPFLHPVSDKEFPEYKKYIIQPMDLTMLEKNIKDNLYGSTQAFEADAKWLLHNSIIFNSYQSKLTSAVKSMIKICKQEMMEIENCPSCYLKANTKKSTWFVEVCPKPHILVWAKLKGFPYWPAKAMSVSSSGLVDVRFFGAHDRAWVHWRECYLYSEKDPNTFKQKRYDIEKCKEELNLYIENLKKIYGEFRFAPFRTLLDPLDIYKQLPIFLPRYKTIKSRRKSYKESSDTNVEDQKNSKSEEVPKDEQSEDIEKSETSSNTHSNNNSPIPENDTTMEGYGTDDDMLSEIDHESRKAFAEKKTLDNKGLREEDGDEDDTQVPTNVLLETVLSRGKVRTRGGFHNSPGKLKILPRLSSERRVPSEDTSLPSQKSSRRNSDQSVKSDSSRASNLSDKINRVNISENMEITLGNEDVGYVSITENLTPTNGDSEHNFDPKRKPVQVDIDNSELTISPSKVKISDELIKRLNDDKNVDGAKKSLTLNESVEVDSTATTSTSNHNNGDKDNEIQSTVTANENISQESVLEKSKLKIIQPSITDYISILPKTADITERDTNSKNTEETSENQVATKEPESAIIEEVSYVNTKSAEKLTDSPIKTSLSKDIAHKLSSDVNLSVIEKSLRNNDVEITPISDPKLRVIIRDEISLTKTVNTDNKSEKISDRNRESPKNKETVDIVEHFDEDEDMDIPNEQLIIDKNKIFEVIHSSLTEKEPNIENKQESSDKQIEKDQKKRKASDETARTSKIVKLIAVESVVNKKDKENNHDNDKTEAVKSADTNPNNIIAPEDIKSEVESDDAETIQMEEKRKYLSALNIHEKTVEKEKKEKNEIRTRSKAEEKREKFKVVDNLTRIIDDVALNYSAIHKGEKLPPKKLERSKSTIESEISIKPFAKMGVSPIGNKQRARKTFPVPAYSQQQKNMPPKKTDVSLFKKDATNKLIPIIISNSPLTSSTSSPVSKVISNVSAPTSVPASSSGPIATLSTMGTTLTTSINVIPSPATKPPTLTMGHVILMPAPTVSYCSSANSPIVNAVTNSSAPISTLSKGTPLSKNVMQSPNLKTSQNYIPHTDETRSLDISSSLTESSNAHKPVETSESVSTEINSSTNSVTNPVVTIEPEDEFAVLNGVIPESVSRAVSDLLLRPPPKLKPRPPGITSQVFDAGIPSTAGNVTSKINSISHRMADYFRGMLIETLEDIGKAANPEAKITGLQLEIESLKHKHAVEMAEMRKNMCTILKDIQRSIVEDRDKIIEDTRAACEEETLKRVELAKSKQWCANCSKEAQFYCCWNTSYCDYPCQQKHWPIHAGKCTQSIEKSCGTGSGHPPRPIGQPIVLRPALPPPKSAMGRIIAKPTKVYMNKATIPQKGLKTVPTSGLTLVETTPGNYELVGGNGSLGLTGKIFTTNAPISNAKQNPAASSGTAPRLSDHRLTSSTSNRS